ncbi:conserved hypothetical protein [Isorropodon fossajaponicum endosymbiont JTNG4]|uniref:hypothetical protein n=1 Tax=Isorropodon fossajaponicum symbiont TaxID=883811 RepID=UPI0019150985|nr:hypothetical protein [Isorropodon fossajaponicum symbiont]BBB24582.1 conserved hypothetical protein [Isorropodon fossajaponicum endosymbiont JTNG4]
MVFLKSLLALTFGFSVLVNYSLAQTTNIIQTVKASDVKVLNLEISYEPGENVFDIKNQADDIKSQLLYHEYQLGIPISYDEQWSKSEQAILNVKMKLEALEEKVKFKGDWGKIRLKLDPKERYRKINLKYQYGF